MPSRDFRGILKMSLFHCSYFIKQLPNGFPSRIASSMHLGCCSNFGKRKNTLACGSSIFTFPKVSRHPSYMDHAILHGKPFGIPLIRCSKSYVARTQHSCGQCITTTIRLRGQGREHSRFHINVQYGHK